MYDKPEPCSIGILLGEDNMVLVEKRRSDDDIDPGLIAFPGGHMELGETMEAALLREMKEELGIEVVDFEWVCSLPYSTDRTDTGETRSYIHHYFVIKKWTGKIVCNEAESVLWTSSEKDFEGDLIQDALALLCYTGPKMQREMQERY